MTAVLTPVNRLADRNLSAQPVDNSGEKLGGTGAQPGTRRGQRAGIRRGRHDSAQQANAGGVPTHIPCGQRLRGRPGITAVVPTIHRAYCDYVLCFTYKLHNQQWVAAGEAATTTSHRAAAGAATRTRGEWSRVRPPHIRQGRCRPGTGRASLASALTYPCARIPTRERRTGGGSQ